MGTYKLISVKGNETVIGTRDGAIKRAIAMEAELQPAYGVTVDDERGQIVAEVENGRVTVFTQIETE